MTSFVKLSALLALTLSSSAFAMLPNPDATSQVAATANSTSSVGQVVTAFLVQNVGGQETLVPVTQGVSVRAGDVVEYHAYFTNHSSDRIRSMSALLEIPAGVEFLGATEPAGAFATVDGTRFGRMPLRANMGGVVQDVPLSMYKALRWDLEDVGIGGTAVVKYRAKIK